MPCPSSGAGALEPPPPAPPLGDGEEVTGAATGGLVDELLPFVVAACLAARFLAAAATAACSRSLALRTAASLRASATAAF
jgi:hypothetical protein